VRQFNRPDDEGFNVGPGRVGPGYN